MTDENEQSIPSLGSVANYPAKPDGWIPVTERLPEDGVEVVALWEGVPEFAIREGGAWQTTAIPPSARFTATHWMPIPPPPTGSK
jgi:hypothetical protein